MATLHSTGLKFGHAVGDAGLSSRRPLSGTPVPARAARRPAAAVEAAVTPVFAAAGA
jgi:hypothetical protein